MKVLQSMSLDHSTAERLRDFVKRASAVPENVDSYGLTTNNYAVIRERMGIKDSAPGLVNWAQRCEDADDINRMLSLLSSAGGDMARLKQLMAVVGELADANTRKARRITISSVCEEALIAYLDAMEETVAEK